MFPKSSGTFLGFFCGTFEPKKFSCSFTEFFITSKNYTFSNSAWLNKCGYVVRIKSGVGHLLLVTKKFISELFRPTVTDP